MSCVYHYYRKKNSRMSQNSRENFYEETDQELHISGNTGTIPEETIFRSNKVRSNMKQ